MIVLDVAPLASLEDAQNALQTAIMIEFSTLPPYLYAKFSIPPGENSHAAAYLSAIVGQEMIHLSLACNILNAIGGSPWLVDTGADAPFPPVYPTTIPGDIGLPGKPPLMVHLLPFSQDAAQQGMNIESPVDPIDMPVVRTMLAVAPASVTIGQFYEKLDAYLKTLPQRYWQQNRNQIADDQFFPGQLFAVNGYQDAHRAIQQIISEGEGSTETPLDFQNEPSHYYRFQEMQQNLVMTKRLSPPGYQLGPQSFGIDWTKVYPAIADPSQHDFSKEPPEAQAAQAQCNAAYTALVDALEKAMNGDGAQLGIAVRAMFDLRKAAMIALQTPLADGKSVAGPSFLYTSKTGGQ